MSITVGVLRTFDREHERYVKACEELHVDYQIIDFMGPNWLQEIQSSNCDGFVVRPSCQYQERKSMCDERLYYLTRYLNKPIYPSYDELFIYENKRVTSHWLELHGFPKPHTWVFTRKKDALRFLSTCGLPIVVKSNIGASAKQVTIVKSRLRAKSIARSLFGYFHPALSWGYVWYRLKKIPIPLTGKAQRHYIILQEYLPIKWEWRIIKIGDSYFGHQKLLWGNYASGSGKVGWVDPPHELLFLVKKVCDTGNFYSMAMDVFETTDGRYIINELQSIFGSNDNSQMYINGIPGRYLFQDGEFTFQKGYFNRHGSYMLRIEHFVKMLSKKKLTINRID